MSLTNIAIRRPLFMLMVIGALLVVGLVSWTKLGVDLLPALDFPIVVVSTPYPGASPEAVDTLVTKRVEDAVASINDIDYIQSSSVQGVSTVIIFFTDKAARDSSIDVERKVAAIRGQLPTDVKDPTSGKFDPNAQPILLLSVSGNRDLGALQRLAEDKLQKRLEGTSGVAQVTVVGGLVREIQVQVDQQKLQARGLSILQVNQALAGDNVNLPAGTRALSIAVLLTGLVLLVFLHTFRSTLIVILSIPTSLVATLGVMYFLGLSLNMMSLMGLTLTVGILVDDSIVVLENIFRHLQLGEAPREAALNGRSEIGFAAIAITLVDVVVLAPIAFIAWITGHEFRP